MLPLTESKIVITKVTKNKIWSVDLGQYLFHQSSRSASTSLHA